MKLQDAYFAETNALGVWASIGYKMDKSTNFEYGGATVTPSITCVAGTYNATKKGCYDGETPTVAKSASLTDSWTATNLVNMNDCAADKNWKISVNTVDPQSASGTGDDAVAATGASIAYSSAALSAGCQTLTPKFVEIAPVATTN